MKFKTEVVISIACGTLACDFGELHKAMEDMAGMPIWTHQLPRALDELEPLLRKRFDGLPKLGDITPENLAAKVKFYQEKFGPEMEIDCPLKGELPVSRIDPLSELAEMVHPDKIHVVNVNE